MTDCGKLKRTLERLIEMNNSRKKIARAYDSRLAGAQDTDEFVNGEAVNESTIQRFEYCFEISWKTVKHYLGDELLLAEVANSPKGVFRLAGDNFLLDAEKWFFYGNLRIGTSHDYSEVKLDEVINNIDEFITDAILLYEKLAGEIWT
jgi:nucleotidyltransferase substrate binding protein (TIGR01987 family)